MSATSDAFETLVQVGAAALNGGRQDRWDRFTPETRTVLLAVLPDVAKLLRREADMASGDRRDVGIWDAGCHLDAIAESQTSSSGR